MSLWVANVAAVRDEPFRAISAKASLAPPTVTKTSRSNYARIMQAKYFDQRFCQLRFHLARLLIGAYFLQ